MRNIPEKISRTKRRKYFFCHSDDQNCRRSKFSKILPLLSPLNYLSSRGLCPLTINRDVTGASHNSPIIGRAAFRGGHPFQHRDVLAPGLACPSLDHHGLSALGGKNRSRSSCRDSAHRHHRWDKAVAKRREGVFWAVPLSRCLSLSLLLPPGAACASLTSLAGCWRETAALVFAWKESPR